MSMRTPNFQSQREEVLEYVRRGMIKQGATMSDAIDATIKIYFFGSDDVTNLYAAIHSGLNDERIAAIVAHDFNGLVEHAPGFSPKSKQFAGTL